MRFGNFLTYIKKIFSDEVVAIPGPLNQSYFPVLDGFRGIAILTVIIGHVSIGTVLGRYFKGNVGVSIFYVLSGFLITTLLFKEKIKTGKVSFKHFYIRRALRILPVAYLFLIVLIFLNHLFKLDITLTSFLAAFFYARNLPLNYGSGVWYNGHFFTLAVEEQFYLLFPLLIVYQLKHYIRLVFLMIIGIPLINYLVYHNVGPFYSISILHKASLAFLVLFNQDTISILIGTMLAILIFNGTLPIIKRGFNYYASFTLLIAGVCIRNSDIINDEYFNSLIFAIIIAIIMYICIESEDLLGSILKNKVIVWIGILSYSIYIWQQLFTHYQPWGNLFKYANSPLLNIPALFLIASLSYYFFEKRFLRLKNRFK